MEQVTNSKRHRNTDFGAFVKRQQVDLAEEEPVDWEKERNDWLTHLKELYARIESFLVEYIRKGEIKSEYRDITLNEENIGSYIARQMILRIGRQQVTMTPIGTMLIGAKGRVDVVGSAGRTRLVLVNSEASAPMTKVAFSLGGKPRQSAPEVAPKKIKWAWKIATSPPAIRYEELTRESLFEALTEIANG